MTAKFPMSERGAIYSRTISEALLGTHSPLVTLLYYHKAYMPAWLEITCIR